MEPFKSHNILEITSFSTKVERSEFHSYFISKVEAKLTYNCQNAGKFRTIKFSAVGKDFDYKSSIISAIDNFSSGLVQTNPEYHKTSNEISCIAHSGIDYFKNDLQEPHRSLLNERFDLKLWAEAHIARMFKS